ncbi:hypothetical protein [Haloprofundus sp. MHR1]|uniref:hypothetical protein n=1 Tax=Haloprofundus sp. MHR1 TaxID=2572921 RepID=UPI0010BF337B|nr:hypothetical protein [Haloprofundus sp. MHR1]QCJ47224.1 hypothetical protein FCF25_08885 [Haloprofundus sp. MHR1]
MTLTGWILNWFDNRRGTKKHPVYQRFREAYHESNQVTRASQIQSGSWVIAVILYHILSNLTQGSVYGIRYPGIAVSIVGVIGLFTSFFAIPGLYYHQNKPFKFSVSWFPLRDKSYLIKKSEEGILRLSTVGEEVIAVVLRSMGSVDGIDIQLVSTNPDVQFKVDGPLGSSLNPYPDDNGFYTRDQVTDEIITPVLNVEKSRDIGSGPNPILHLVDVSNVEYQRRGELSNNKALKKGVKLLSIEVEE